MNKREVITLSSDEEKEDECTLQSQIPKQQVSKVLCENNDDKSFPKICIDSVISLTKPFQRNSNEKQADDSLQSQIRKRFTKCYEKKEKKVVQVVANPPQSSVQEVCTNKSPELVDLVDGETSPENIIVPSENGKIENNKVRITPLAVVCSDIDAKEKPSFSKLEKQQTVNCLLDEVSEEDVVKNSNDLLVGSNDHKIVKDKKTVRKSKGNNTGSEVKNVSVIIKKERTDTAFFDEFVNICGSLEQNPADRARLLKKLYRRFEEANPKYIESNHFKSLIEKCKNRINSNNLYLVAKEITDELCARKKIEIQSPKFNSNEKNNNGSKSNEMEQEKCKNNKQSRIIKKILRNLDLLGNKIRELENTEVDLSDEEDSSYIRLQRYRYRFCLIYKKLCEYTNEISDANRVYSRKITFSGSKYLEINKCIEKWLNKTKRFPDFTDIMKLLESQSSSLGLPSNQEMLRPIALEIFQQVGIMLQQRRKYDLWDSFCGFLNDSEDPANNSPELENVLKQNYENRVKKEQEIIAHYAELQESERLKPEEVPEEEACCSPVESGNEDEEELEEIEKSINEKLDVSIEEEHFLYERKKNGNDNVKSPSGNKRMSISRVESAGASNTELSSTWLKESKNNYKNCKSLKWREDQEMCVDGGSADGEINSGSKTTETDAEIKTTEECEIIGKKENSQVKVEDLENKAENDDSDVVFITSEPIKKTDENVISSITSPKIILDRMPNSAGAPIKTPLKSGRNSENRPFSPKKRKLESHVERNESENNCTENNNNKKCKKSDSVFEVQYCEVKYNFRNVFQKLDCVECLDANNKGEVRKKVFRDLTNINQLLKPNRIKRKFDEFFKPTFYQRGIVRNIETSLGEKRFRVNYGFTSLRERSCALNEGEKKSAGKVKDESKEAKKKSSDNNSERQVNEACNGMFGGSGNGREDNNGNDENKKNGKVKEEAEESKIDEEEKDEENEDEKGAEIVSRVEGKSKQTRKGKRKSKKNVKESRKQSASRLNAKKDSVVVEENKNFSKSKKSSTKPKTSRDEKVVDVQVNSEEKVNNVRCTRLRTRLQRAKKVECVKRSRSPMEEVEVIEESTQSRNSSFQYKDPSDEERVKNFLMNSPSSISIIPPKNLLLPNVLSVEAIQALATLRKLKEISATIVRKPPTPEDDVTVISESPTMKRNAEVGNREIESDAKCANEMGKRRGSHLPVITNVQTVDSAIPKIVTVQGNVAGFENTPNTGRRKKRNQESGSNCSTIRISNVWGSYQNDFGQNEGDAEPRCSFKQKRGDSNSARKKKKSKKSVEYVVLD